MPSEGHSRDPLANRRKGTVDPLELLAIDDHILLCPSCRKSLPAIVESYQALLSLQASVAAAEPTTGHLTVDSLRAYVEDRLSAVDCELAECHLETCALCRAQAQGLKQRGK
jgi:predicted anti-sigma-YlaC factor YlaD